MLSIKSHNPLITWTHQVTWRINVISPYPRNLWTPNLAGLWLMIRTKNYKVKCLFNDVVMWGHVAKKNVLFPLLRGLWPLKLKGWLLMMRGHHSQWSHDTIVPWQIKKVNLYFYKAPWLPNSTRWWLMILVHHAQSHVILWSRNRM